MNRYPLLIMFVMLAFSWSLKWLYPLASGLGLIGKVVGWIVILYGISLIVVAAGLFRIKGTTVNPTKQPDKLMTVGIYRITRNPMYLGMLLILSGFPFIAESILGLIFPVIFFFIMDRMVIPKEEKVVEDVFDEAYLRYKSKTRRWIG
jgi:protein-S-isoprenylcysteine O-methyltransferase Ste14